MISKTTLLANVLALSLGLAVGCSTTGENVALAVAGTAGAYVVGNTFATRSELDVKVEAFDSSRLTPQDREDFEQGTVALLRGPAMGLGDVVTNPAPAKIRIVVEQLREPMLRFGETQRNLKQQIASIQKLRDDTEVDELLDTIASGLDALSGPKSRLDESREKLKAQIVLIRKDRNTQQAEKLDGMLNGLDTLAKPTRRLGEIQNQLKQQIDSLRKFKDDPKEDESVNSVISGLGALSEPLFELGDLQSQLKQQVVSIRNLGDNGKEDKQLDSVTNELDALSEPLRELGKMQGQLREQIVSFGELRISRAADALLDSTLRELGTLAESNARVLACWEELKQAFGDSVAGGIGRTELEELANYVAKLRMALADRDDYVISGDAPIRWLGLHLAAQATDLISVAGGNVRDVDATGLICPPGDDASGPNKDRIAARVVGFVTLLKERGELRATSSGNDNTGNPSPADVLSKALGMVGIMATAAELSELWTTTPAELRIKAAVLADRRMNSEQAITERGVIWERTFVGISVDFNIGNIRDELIQVLLTPEAINHILREENKDHWREFSSAVSSGRAGNHDVIVYFEHLGLPIIKEGAFDPSQFQAANGLMFRKAFGAVADVVGVPVASVQSSDGRATPVGSINISEVRKARGEAQKQREESQKAILDALGKVIAQAESLQNGGDLAAKRAAVAEALKRAADQLKPEETGNGEEQEAE